MGRAQQIRSFSGAHPFRVACLVGALDPVEVAEVQGVPVDEFVEEIVATIEEDRCPRCYGPLGAEGDWLPAGSHATGCRCIPICSACGDHESLTGWTNPIDWPFDQHAVYATVATIRSLARPAILDPHTGVLIDETGAIGTVNNPDPDS